MDEIAIRIYQATSKIPIEALTYFRGKTVRNNARLLRGSEHVNLIWNNKERRVELVCYGFVAWHDGPEQR